MTSQFMAIPLPLCSPSNLTLTFRPRLGKEDFIWRRLSRRAAIIEIAAVTLSLTSAASARVSSPSNAPLDGISNTTSWLQFFGDGFSIRVPPLFEDINEPEDYSAGQSLYGDKAKPKTFAARFASPDRSEVLSVVIQPSNKLKLTFLEAKDITDIGSLKESAKIFVPGGANLYAARTYRIKENEAFRHTFLVQLPPKLNGKMMVLSFGLPHYPLQFCDHFCSFKKSHSESVARVQITQLVMFLCFRRSIKELLPIVVQFRTVVPS